MSSSRGSGDTPVLWLNPSALFALAAAAAPILIHLLIQRRAERLPFPTLRFLQPTRLAAIRRHLLDDLPLLAVRVALLSAAVAALAGPLIVTPARRQAWDRRVVLAVVSDAAGAERARPSSAAEQAPPLRAQRFQTSALPDGIRRAVHWLDTTPPARREIVIATAFPIGSITQADVAAIPPDVGVRFERTGALPESRTAAAGRVLTPDGVRQREVTLDGERTSVRESPAIEPLVWPIDVVASGAERPAIDAAIAAVLSQRVWAALPDHRTRLVLANALQAVAPPPAGDSRELRRDTPKREGDSPAVADAAVIASAWMADAVAKIARDPDLRAAAPGVVVGLTDARFTATPWQILALAADGRPLAAAAGSADRLLVASAAPASEVATAVLLRSIANAIASVPDLQPAEIVPISGTLLRQWSRPSTPPPSPRVETVEADDRRWLWLAALVLMALEMWLRRARQADISGERREENARVA